MKAAILLPTLAARDAVGNDALAMAQLLSERGIDTRLFCDIAVGIEEKTYPPAQLLDFAGGPRDLLIYHFSVGCPAAYGILTRARGFRVVRYHNITPPQFFSDYAPDYADACARGRAEIPAIAKLGCELYVGDSRFNLDELIEYGAPVAHGAVLAPFHRIEQLIAAEADLGLLDELDDGSRNILMVGRIAPNKGHAELVDAFAAFIDAYGDPARLLIVGKTDPRLHGYMDAIQARINVHRLGARVRWFDSINEAQLKSVYLASHAFLTLSQHEGFCVPLIEAMALAVPVVAYGSSAIPATLGCGGVVWNETNPWLYAASIARIGEDVSFRNDLLQAARVRYETEFASAVLRERFFKAMEPAL